MTQIINRCSSDSLIRLQKEYLSQITDDLEEISVLCDELEEASDPAIIKSCCETLQQLEAKVDENYRISNEIELVIEKQYLEQLVEF